MFLSSSPCRSLISSLGPLGVSRGCAAWRRAGSGRKLMAELHHQKSNNRAVSPGCKLQVRKQTQNEIKMLMAAVFKNMYSVCIICGAIGQKGFGLVSFVVKTSETCDSDGLGTNLCGSSLDLKVLVSNLRSQATMKTSTSTRISSFSNCKKNQCKTIKGKQPL